MLYLNKFIVPIISAFLTSIVVYFVTSENILYVFKIFTILSLSLALYRDLHDVDIMSRKSFILHFSILLFIVVLYYFTPDMLSNMFYSSLFLLLVAPLIGSDISLREMANYQYSVIAQYIKASLLCWIILCFIGLIMLLLKPYIGEINIVNIIVYCLIYVITPLWVLIFTYSFPSMKQISDFNSKMVVAILLVLTILWMIAAPIFFVDSILHISNITTRAKIPLFIIGFWAVILYIFNSICYSENKIFRIFYKISSIVFLLIMFFELYSIWIDIRSFGPLALHILSIFGGVISLGGGMIIIYYRSNIAQSIKAFCLFIAIMILISHPAWVKFIEFSNQNQLIRLQKIIDTNNLGHITTIEEIKILVDNDSMQLLLSIQSIEAMGKIQDIKDAFGITGDSKVTIDDIRNILIQKVQLYRVI
jgi:hypothetical protein